MLYLREMAACSLVLMVLLTLAVAAQTQNSPELKDDYAGAASLQGYVRDSHGQAIASATVYLRTKTGTETLTARTDAGGAYRFSGLRGDVYILRVEMAGYNESTLDPCVLGATETKQVDLSLDSGKQAGAATTSQPDPPQFFDEPKFTVAGVTEAMNAGGHGSDMTLRMTDSLAKETVLLGRNSPNAQARKSDPSARTKEEEFLRKAADREPENVEANRRLGQLLIEDGKAQEALVYLERASRINPSDYETAWALAFAHADVGQYEQARTEAQSLLVQHDEAVKQQAELHRFLGGVYEKLGRPLDAVREYQSAAELNPNESDLFDWGADLLLHRAYEPALEVFTKGNHLFPRSARILAGLAVAAYARGAYDEALQHLCDASDIRPSDVQPYLFMGKMQTVQSAQPSCVEEKLSRFVVLQPENAFASYYDALRLLNHQKNSAVAEKQVELLLNKAIELNPKFGAAYLQLGIIYADRGDFPEALEAYQKAANADPELKEAHYHLARAYSRKGEKSKAETEFQLYRQLSKKTAEDDERQRRDIQQFVYTLRDGTSAAPPQ